MKYLLILGALFSGLLMINAIAGACESFAVSDTPGFFDYLLGVGIGAILTLSLLITFATID